MRRGIQVKQDSEECQVSRDQRDQSDPGERRAVRVLRGWGGQKESEGLQVCQGFQEHQDFQVCRDRMDHQAPGECPAATGQRVTGVSQDLEGSPELLVCRVHLVYLDKRETQVM